MLPVIIVVAVITLLSEVAIGVFAMLTMLKKIHFLPFLIIMCGAGALAMSAIFLSIPCVATAIIGLVFAIPGWGGLVAGFIMLSLELWKAPKAATDQAPPAGRAPGQKDPPPGGPGGGRD